MKINVGIVGFGNLGKALHKQLVNHNCFNLVAVFSRRNIIGTIPYNEILNHKDQIDLLFLCGGSQNDLENQENFLIKHFNIIDSYDNHQQLEEHIKNIDKIAKRHEKIALCSFGWDPGLFSLMRGLFYSLGFTPHTFWGKGVSQGHTNAIKQIDGVIDAIQFTVPNEITRNKLKNGEIVSSENMHIRECFVVCDETDQKRIKHEILTMPHYFAGYETIVNFINQQQLDLMKNFAHKGEVLTTGNILNFSLNTNSNPDFTANILINYAKSYKKLKQNNQFGAHTILDIPINYILNENNSNLIL